VTRCPKEKNTSNFNHPHAYTHPGATDPMQTPIVVEQ
jgi:hypothetical protein